jgi:hypothetical protein
MRCPDLCSQRGFLIRSCRGFQPIGLRSITKLFYVFDVLVEERNFLGPGDPILLQQPTENGAPD